ncbi:hypothetical protein LTR70_004950 [Exophiala xenobiotica]|nr:hypothetical protein LTR70_004950 [Exophiala xenobiotica]
MSPPTFENNLMGGDMFNPFDGLNDNDIGGNWVGDSFETFISTAEDEELFDSLFQTNEAHYASPDNMPAVGIMGLYVDAACNAVESRRSGRASVEQGSPPSAIPNGGFASSGPLLYNGANGFEWQIKHDEHAQVPATTAQLSANDSQQLSSYQGYPGGVRSQPIGNNFTEPSPFAPLALSTYGSTQPTQLSSGIRFAPLSSDGLLNSQEWLNQYGRNHPGFDVPNLSNHDFLRPDVTPEENFELMRDHVQKEREKVEDWEDHIYHPKKWHRGLTPRVWPFNISPDARPKPESYCPGQLKPADTAEGNKCLQCEHNDRECYGGPTANGKCTTCQGAKGIRKYLKSIDARDKASGQTRRCYWPQREFFMNDFHTVKLFHKDCRWIDSNTAEAIAEHEKDEEKLKAARARKEARTRKEEARARATTAKSQERARKAAEMTQAARAAGAASQRQPQSAAPPTRPQTVLTSSVPRPNMFKPGPYRTGILNPVAQGLIPASGQQVTSGSALSRMDEPTLNNRGTKRGREAESDELGVPAKRTRVQTPTNAMPQIGNGTLSTPRTSQETAAADPIRATASSGDDVESSYARLHEQRDQYHMAGNYMEAAQIQAAINVAGDNKALATRLAVNRSSPIVMEQKFVMLAAYSDETLEGMIRKLNEIQIMYELDPTEVTDKDRVLALRIQTAMNVSLGGEYTAPAAFLIRDRGFQAELQRLALAEKDGGPFDTYRPLAASEIVSILYHASRVTNDRFRSHIGKVLEPLGVPEGVWTEDAAHNVPDHIARILESLVYYASRA